MLGNEVITPAMRLLGILMETESPSANQSATGLTALNNMMADLSGDGVDVGYAPQSDPNVDIGLNIEARQAVIAMLAIYIAPIYTRQPPPVVVAMATNGRNKILRDSIYQNRQPSTMTHVPLGSRWNRYWNILTGN
jgi:hypothetical protein